MSDEIAEKICSRRKNLQIFLCTCLGEHSIDVLYFQWLENQSLNNQNYTMLKIFLMGKKEILTVYFSDYFRDRSFLVICGNKSIPIDPEYTLPFIAQIITRTIVRQRYG